MATKLTDFGSIEAIISEMTLEEKARLVTGGSPFATCAIERFGIPSVRLLDGCTGVNLVQYYGDLLTRLRMSSQSGVEIGMFGTISSGTIKRILIKLDKGQKLTEKEQTIYDTACAEMRKIVPQPQAPGAFPTGILLGATWNREAVHQCASAVGREMDAYHVDVVLGTPNVNLHRDPLNGRVFEGYSEDPCLTAQLAPEFVKGVQEEGPLANVKHFAANNQETCRHSINVRIGERALRELYFPGFRACVQEGKVRSVMSAYNKINGESCAMNHWLLTDVLRKDWGFDGFVVSDWGAAYDQVKALSAGNDLDQPGPRNIQPILDAVESGELPLSVLDESVRRVLQAIVQSPAMRGRRYSAIDRGYSRAAAHRCAAEGIVLLKNNGLLPLDPHTSVTFVGEGSRRFNETGDGSTEVYTDQWTSMYRCAAEIAGEAHTFFGLQSLAQTDAAVITVQAPGQEGSDRTGLSLPDDQLELLQQTITEAKRLHKHVVVVLNVAGPVDVTAFASDVDAILCVFFPGMEGGRAAAEILYGLVNPSGKLPLTFPAAYRDCPSFGNFPGSAGEVFYGEGIYVGYRYYEKRQIKPAYAFGYGLSYTNFMISDLQLDHDRMDADAAECVHASVRVRNIGRCTGKEVVQLYISDVESTLDKPVKELKGFEKIELAPGEEKLVRFTITRQMLKSFDPEYGIWACESGLYRILVGNSSDQISCSADLRVKSRSIYDYSPRTCLKKLYDDPRSRAMLIETIHAVGLDENVLADELYYRKFRPIGVVLQNLPNADPKRKEQSYQLFYQNIAKLDLTDC